MRTLGDVGTFLDGWRYVWRAFDAPTLMFGIGYACGLAVLYIVSQLVISIMRHAIDIVWTFFTQGDIE